MNNKIAKSQFTKMKNKLGIKNDQPGSLIENFNNKQAVKASKLDAKQKLGIKGLV